MESNHKKNLTVSLILILSGLYLVNPGFGIFELIPDAVPIIGNLDEGTAAVLFISSLSYFGIDLRQPFGSWWKRKKTEE